MYKLYLHIIYLYIYILYIAYYIHIIYILYTSTYIHTIYILYTYYTSVLAKICTFLADSGALPPLARGSVAKLLT